MTSRTECSPRKIKRIKKETESKNNDKNNKKENDNEESRQNKKNNGQDNDDNSDTDIVYNFYRLIIHPMILRLNNQKGKDILLYIL